MKVQIEVIRPGGRSRIIECETEDGGVCDLEAHIDTYEEAWRDMIASGEAEEPVRDTAVHLGSGERWVPSGWVDDFAINRQAQRQALARAHDRARVILAERDAAEAEFLAGLDDLEGTP